MRNEMSTPKIIDDHKLTPLLVDPQQAAKALNITREEFYRNVAKICANHGLQPVLVGGRKKYSYQQLVEIVNRCRKNSEPLYEK